MSAAPQLPEEILHINGAATNGYKHTNDNQATKRRRMDTEFEIHKHPVENFRPLKVIIVGAGYSGIYCGIRMPERLRNVELVIYEKNDGIGGAWYENRYPGCACDVPSHSYQFSFDPNPSWSSLYAPAKEIYSYLQRIVKKYAVDRFIKLSHAVRECRFDKTEGKWHVTVEDLKTGEMLHDTADALINARGNLNTMSWPKIPGLDSFKGEVMHSAKWNQDYNFRDKRIGVIGCGSSAIQIVPNLQKISGTQLSVFARSRTWITPPFGAELFDKLGLTTHTISEELREKFATNPTALQDFRETIEADGNNIHAFTIKDTEMQKEARVAFEGHMKKRLAKKPKIFESLLPDFRPGCRRLTPGPGFLEALVEDNVDFVTKDITSIEQKGLRTADGKFHELDVLCCATGFKTSEAPPFPVTGLHGTTIQQHWSQWPTNYLSLATDGFPNMFVMLGPNAAIGTGSLTMMIESVGDYIIKCIRKMQKEDIKSMTVKRARVDDFGAYCDSYFDRTVYTDQCQSWYKRNGRITGLWPGSTLHCIESLRSPRWEDFEYEYKNGDGNRLAWLGNGWSENQVRQEHLAWYLYPEFQDKPEEGLPERKKRYEMRAWSH